MCSQPDKPFDYLGFIIDVETEGVDEETLVEGVQYLIDTGLINSIQGSWQRLAGRLIEYGFCIRRA